MAGIAIQRVVKAYGSTPVIHGIDIAVAEGEFAVLVGPSGCGKSTLLRMIAGLESITDGTIAIGDRVVNDLPPRDRDIAMVFQDYALYPHKTVFENMAFGLRMRKSPEDVVKRKVDAAAEILKIGHLLQRRPSQLSGGQRQRVAMGRAIVRDPKVFLFDEPLSNLDAQLRGEMRVEIKRLHQQIKTTIVYVTHDQVEAMTLADRIAVMKGGYLEQLGTPDDVYSRPASRFVAGFIGSPTMNFVDATIGAGGSTIRLKTGVTLAVPAGRHAELSQLAGRAVVFGIRPEHLSFGAHGPDMVGVATKASMVEPLGSDTLVTLSLDGAEMTARFPPEAGVRVGDTVELGIAMSRFHLFDPESGQALAGRPKL